MNQEYFYLLILSKFIKFLILFFFINLFLQINKNNESKAINPKNFNKIKICLCTLGKNENRYIREFIIHYEKYGIDKIFLYDNNDINGEHFEEIINDYINKGFVEILNWRGAYKCQHKIMNDCYQRNNNKYNWLIFYDLDEFIYLYNNMNLKYFLNQKKFNKCQLIYLNLICHTDNNLLYYENKSLFERFPEIAPLKKKNRGIEVKFIIRGNISNIKIKNLHYGNKNLRNCNGFGHQNKIIKNIFTSEPDFKYYYIDHFYSKSTEEFINKITRGDASKDVLKNNMHRVKKYYLQSNFTEKKIDMIEKGTGLNLSEYKQKLNLK